MKDEIKEILEALRDSIDDTGTDKVNFINWVDKIEDYITNLQEKVNQYENPDDMALMFMWCDEKAKDKIKQLQERIAYLERSNNRREDEIMSLRDECVDGETYKSRNEKAINEVIRVLQIILEQPSEDKLDDLWIINKLEGIQTLLQGEDKDE